MPQGQPTTRVSALSWLWGARVQRVDGPSPNLFALSLFQRGDKPVLLLWVSPARRGVGASRERPKGEAASAFVRRLRTKLENARLVEAHWLAPQTVPDAALALELTFAKGEVREVVLADFDGGAPNLLLLTAQGCVAGASDERALRTRLPGRFPPFQLGHGRGVSMPADEASLFATGEQLLESAVNAGDAAFRNELRSQAKAALKRLERKAQAIQGDLDRALSAPLLRREATLLLCNLHAIPRGAARAILHDESLDPPEPLELKLDPSRDAQQNAQQRFERARKLERGTTIARQRLTETEKACALTRDLLSRIERDAVEELTQTAEHLGLRVLPGLSTKKRHAGQEHVAFRSFEGHAGRSILVGKGAADNDTLTLTIARPHDHWLHVRGVQGAHVIVPTPRGAQIPPELLLDAAHLAAHFSAVRGEPSAEIQHTERRYLRKPKGAAPGAVNVDREKVLLLRIEPDRLARLLGSERT